MDYNLIKKAQENADLASELLLEIKTKTFETAVHTAGVDNFSFLITVFVLACFVGYYVVWKVTPALHTPLMALTNAVSSIIIIGAIIAAGAKGFEICSVLGFFAVLFASIIFLVDSLLLNECLKCLRRNSNYILCHKIFI